MSEESVIVMSEEEYARLAKRGRPQHRGDYFSLRHPQMSTARRAKIFAPFAALKGFAEEVSSQDAVYEMRPPLDEDTVRKLDEQLRRLYETVRFHPEAEAVFFRVCDDPHHASCGRLGSRETVRGFVQEISIPHQYLRISGQIIAFADLLEIRIKDR